MRRFSKTSKKGFTLIEIVLAMAIMIIVMSIVWGTFAIINQSHANVVVVNDAKDFAGLYMEAIENIVSNASELTVGDSSATKLPSGKYNRSIFIESASGPDYGVLKMYNGNVLEDALRYDQFKVSTPSGNVNKWIIDPVFRLESDTLYVELKVKDNADGTYYTTLTRTIFLSNIETTASTGNGNIIFFKIKSFPT
jgi:type II secretory pathway pseudopilin PulG